MNAETFKNFTFLLSDLEVFCQMFQMVPLPIYSNKGGCILRRALWTQAVQASLIRTHVLHVRQALLPIFHHGFSGFLDAWNPTFMNLILIQTVACFLLLCSSEMKQLPSVLVINPFPSNNLSIRHGQPQFILKDWALFCCGWWNPVWTINIWLPRALIYTCGNWGMRTKSLSERLKTRGHCKLFSYQTCKTLYCCLVPAVFSEASWTKAGILMNCFINLQKQKASL